MRRHQMEHMITNQYTRSEGLCPTWATRGPPESPWQASIPSSPAQIMLAESADKKVHTKSKGENFIYFVHGNKEIIPLLAFCGAHSYSLLLLFCVTLYCLLLPFTLKSKTLKKCVTKRWNWYLLLRCTRRCNLGHSVLGLVPSRNKVLDEEQAMWSMITPPV